MHPCPGVLMACCGHEVIAWTSAEEIILLSLNDFHLRTAAGDSVSTSQLKHKTSLDLQ